jgi:hypothetical protein
MLPTLAARFSHLHHKDSLFANQQSLSPENLLTDFADNSFRLHISLEEISYVKNLSEYLYQAYRTLQVGGRFVATFQFVRNNIASTSNSDNILLVGWDIIDKLSSIGFMDIQFILGWSREYVNLGPEQFFLYATK